MPSREVMNLYNEDVRFATSKFTDWTDQQTVTIASDPTVPSAPTLVANAADQAIDLVITAPTTNTDGSAIVDLKDYTVYYSTSSGIDTTNPSTYSGTFNTASTRHTFATDAKHYFKVVCNDKWSNSSSGSNEVSATPTTANGPVDVDDYTDNIETIAVGDGMIGIKFQLPKTSWQRWAAWKLYAEDDAGSGSLPGTPTWDLIYNGSGPGFIYKGLNTAWIYEFKLTVLGEDGTETTGTISDNSGAGYQPNGSDNDNLVAIDIFAENIVATNEVRGNNISSSTTITAGSGNNVGVLDGADATYRIYAGNSDPTLAPFRVTQAGVATLAGATISGTVTVTGGDVPYSYVSSGPPANADHTADIVGAMAYEDLVEKAKLGTTIISGGYIKADLLTATNITTGTLDASVVSVTNLNASNITTGTLTGRTVRTSSGTTRAEMASGSYPFAFYYGSDKKFWVDTSGNVYAKTLKDTNGQTLVNSGVFQGARLIALGSAGSYNNGTGAISNAVSTVSMGSRTVPSGKKWVVFVTPSATSGTSAGYYHSGTSRGYWKGFWVRQWAYFYNSGTYYGSDIGAGTYSSLYLYVYHAFQMFADTSSNDAWATSPVLYMIWEVPA